MRRLLGKACAVVALVLGGAVPPGLAAPLTFDFTGTVTQVPVLDPSDPFGGTIHFQTPFTGSYTFEATTPDSLADPQTGVYSMAAAPFGLTVTMGGHPFSAGDSLSIVVFDGPPDQYGVLAHGAGGDLTIELFLEDPTGTALASDALPLTPPALADFAVREFHLAGLVDGNQVQIDGCLDSLSPAGQGPPPLGGTSCAGARVPAPATLLLMAVGMAGLAWRRRP
jgi:hypothetical protein